MGAFLRHGKKLPAFPAVALEQGRDDPRRLDAQLGLVEADRLAPNPTLSQHEVRLQLCANPTTIRPPSKSQQMAPMCAFCIESAVCKRACANRAVGGGTGVGDVPLELAGVLRLQHSEHRRQHATQS